MKKMRYRFEQKADSNVHNLYIYDDVTAVGDFDCQTGTETESETSAGYFKKQLAEIPETDEIELHINSYGGDVKEGTAIYNLLKQHGAKKTCYVDGFAYSIASVIAMACDRIIMGLGTSMLIHNMAMCVYGNAQELRKCADDLDVLMASNRQIYLSRSKNLTEDELIQMMDEETFLTPEHCLEYGFCDEIAELHSVNQQKEKDEDPDKEDPEVDDPEEPEDEPEGDPEEPEEPETEEDPEKKKKTSQEKVLDLAGAFFNAFNAERRTK